MSELEKQEQEFNALEAEIIDEEVDQGKVIQEQLEPETAEIIKPILEMGFAVLAPNWNVQGEEVEQLSVSYGALIDRYFPYGLGDHGVEINALMITAAIVLPRIKTPRKIEQEGQPNGETA